MSRVTVSPLRDVFVVRAPSRMMESQLIEPFPGEMRQLDGQLGSFMLREREGGRLGWGVWILPSDWRSGSGGTHGEPVAVLVSLGDKGRRTWHIGLRSKRALFGTVDKKPNKSQQPHALLQALFVALDEALEQGLVKELR